MLLLRWCILLCDLVVVVQAGELGKGQGARKGPLGPKNKTAMVRAFGVLSKHIAVQLLALSCICLPRLCHGSHLRFTQQQQINMALAVRKPFLASCRPSRAQMVVKAATWQKATTSEWGLCSQWAVWVCLH